MSFGQYMFSTVWEVKMAQLDDAGEVRTSE